MALNEPELSDGGAWYTWTKQVASSYGGTRNGMVAYWPKGIPAKGEVRTQWHHVIDIAPTILAAAGLPEPKFVNGIAQAPIEGVSMLPTFKNAKAPETHLTAFSGKIAKVTIDLKEMKPADKAAADKAAAEVEVKKALWK